MKIRSMKLREAHNNNGVSTYCTILWDRTAAHIVTASSSDVSISIHDALLPSATAKSLRNHKDGVTALAISPNSVLLASGSSDRSVKLYRFPGNTCSLFDYICIFLFRKHDMIDTLCNRFQRFRSLLTDIALL